MNAFEICHIYKHKIGHSLKDIYANNIDPVFEIIYKTTE
jgi:hypothetical protein